MPGFVASSSRLAFLGLLTAMCCAYSCGSRSGLAFYEQFSPDPSLGGAAGSEDAALPVTDSAAGMQGTGGHGATGGTGSLVCPMSLTRCGDSCVDLETDRAHCGDCERACPLDEQCIGGECRCPPGKLTIESVAPKNGATGVSAAGMVSATFTCTLERALARDENARLYGHSSGYIASDFPVPDRPDALWLDPVPSAVRLEPYFAGERVTAWLGERLSGPHLWQFSAAVSSSSPGKFQKGTQDLSGVTSAYDSVFADLDQDGDLDVAARSDGGVVLLFNLDRGQFAQPKLLSVKGKPIVGDVDRDGDLDLMAGGSLLRNDGGGGFSDRQERASCAALGDFDGDGDLDCVSSSGSGSAGVLLNDGTGSFVAGSIASFGTDCEVADLDGDADLDVLCIAPVTEAGRVFLNDGSAVFTRTEQVLGDSAPRAIAIGDIDADGDIDAVMAEWWGGGRAASNLVWLNDGKGKFSAGGTLGDDGTAIALGDLDGDGDLDALVSHAGPYLSGPYHPTRLFLNDGAGRFTEEGRTLGDPSFHQFALGDLDGDGDLDAFVYHQVVSASRSSYSAVWFNKG